MLGTLPRAGERLGRYEVLEEIAHGGMAAVYLVRLSGRGGFARHLAMKVLLPHLSGDRHFVAMFLDEARIASAVQHANVVQVFELGEAPGQPYLVMELLRGQPVRSLAARAKQGGPPPPASLWLEILAQAAEGLHAAHETRAPDGATLGIVHRDVSPQNVHVGYDGLVKVVDFGIAAAKGRMAETRSDTIKGTFRYVAPELVTRAREVDRRADLWSLGVMAWELLAGASLFRGEDDAETLWNVLHRTVPPLADAAPSLPPRVAATVHACLARDPGKRPATAREVAEVLREGARQGGVTGSTEVRDHMARVFGAERERDEERLRAYASAATDVAPMVDGPGPRTSATVSEARPPLGTRRHGARRVLVAMAALLTIAAVGVTAGTSLGKRDEPAPIAPEAPAGAQAAAAEVPAPEPAAPTPVRVTVDPRATMVLVDGARHDERPLLVAVPAGASVTVEMVAPSGRIVRRSIDASSDGLALRLPDDPPRRAAPRPAPSSSPPSKRLMGNPY